MFALGKVSLADLAPRILRQCGGWWSDSMRCFSERNNKYPRRPTRKRRSEGRQKPTASSSRTSASIITPSGRTARSAISLRNASSRENLYQSQAPGRTAKPVRPSAWDCQPPPQSSHQPTLRTNIPPGPVFGTRSGAIWNISAGGGLGKLLATPPRERGHCSSIAITPSTTTLTLRGLTPAFRTTWTTTLPRRIRPRISINSI